MIVDEASQRTFAVSIFVLIQAWKLFDLVTIKVGEDTGRDSFSFVVKYIFVDGLFIWTLSLLNILGLSYGPVRALLYSVVLFAISLVGISNGFTPLANGFIESVAKVVRDHKELTIAGERVVAENAIDLDSHFKGKYTINFLPDASARMNPFGFNLLCLDGSKTVVNMPIEFNTTSALGSFQIQRITENNNKVTLLNYTKSDITRFQKKDYTHLKKYPKYRADDERIFYLEYPITTPGTYTIKSVTDENGISIRTYKSVFKIAQCPLVEFVPTHTNTNYWCLEDTAVPQQLSLPLVKVKAVFPAVVKYIATLNGKPYHKFETKVENENNGEGSASYTRNFLEQELYKHPEILAKAKPGAIEFHLSEIKDGLGVSRRFNTALKETNVWHKLVLKGSIGLKLVDKSPQEDLIENGDKTLFIESLNIEDSEFPISITFQYDGNGSDILLHNITKIFQTREQLSKGINVKSQGKYNIISALSKFCPCKFSKNQYVSLALAQKAHVKISASPVTDACIGTLGYIFDFDFIGKPPFQVDYQVYRNHSGTLSPVYDSTGSTIRHIKTSFRSFKFEYKPETEGNFVVKFSKLKDMNYYAKPIQLEDKVNTYETYFKKKSQVSFSKSGHGLMIIRPCYNESVDIPVYFTGNGPFSFAYSLIDITSGEKLIQSVPVKDVTGEYVIQTPKLTKSARYKVDILNPVDGASCGVVKHSSDSVIIESRGEIPKVSIAEDLKIIKIVEGDSYRIPLDFQTDVGRQTSDLLRFKHVVDSSKITFGELKSSENFIVLKEGTYSLESFSNGGCNGEIVFPQRSITIEYYERPSISVIAEDVASTPIPGHFELHKVCQTGSRRATLKFSGSPPFVIDYTVKLPNGKIESGSMTSNSKSMIINLPTEQFGTYEHSFTGIFDSHYTKQKQRLNQDITTNIRYEVRANPLAVFTKDQNFLQVCESNFKNSKLALPISFTSGDSPFTVSFKLDNDRQFTIENIVKDIVDISEHVTHLDVGEHLIEMINITDSNGCTSSELSTNDKYVIHITETPDVERVGIKTDYCVGDHVYYNLSGVGPFTVFYRFRGQLQRAQVLHSFRRLAAKAGTLEIEAITDSSRGSCLVNFTQTPVKFEALKLTVHELPSVEINQGDNIVENIHEGDQAEIKFTFKGTPPFRVKYIRTVEDKQKKRLAPVVVETKVLQDIWDYEHHELVNMEGTYEAVEIYDSHCHVIKQ
ncbi:uncharacterized protein KQ657_002877 [Scheffersomyces spartinae]|uniref:Nucleoporin n=1 Tax=Scheffersomyces spartinae TaxID=45513 RepID=A0A9P8AGL5_9ASCO|nr:uncharacterized protein KQ657_002877 [Scheffersomyces spartinae]KAG7191741.1 hypothetical protein KQ657_002877 [Scheffersomyces spartinae]